MNARIRISTSPPNVYEPVEDDASYYCDMISIDHWGDFTVVVAQTDELKAVVNRSVLDAYIVYGLQDGEIGVVVCYEDDDEGLMYCGVDNSGRAKSEPAVNEALWHVANAAVALPNGHRLQRNSSGILEAT